MLPLSLLAQLDKLTPGLSLQDFRRIFPSAIPDLPAMTCNMYKNDTLLGIPGESQYTAVKDSVNQYAFRSILFSGPSSDFPKADSAELLHLIRSAHELTGHYLDIFGSPTMEKSISPRISIKDLTDPNVYSAIWNKPDGTIKILVHQDTEIANNINAEGKKVHEKKMKCAKYVLEVQASGKWSKLRIDFEIGITKDQFRVLMPIYAEQMKNFPDCWTVKESVLAGESEWHMWFLENALAGFSYDNYCGDAYSGTNKACYPILINKAKQFLAEGELAYGQPITLQVPASDAYTPIKKVPNEFFYDYVYYNAEWKMDKGKNLFIRLHENGGKGEAFLHLEVYFGTRKD